ncbi:DUF4139 domain-containing protein [Sphingomonas sp. RS6]
MLARIALALIALLAAAPAVAQALVVSETPDSVAVTLYRDPNRGDGPMSRYWPGGYALVTETRTITLPAGSSVIRFVGVSEGMMPETAIVSGLPQGAGEKNRDARLLSPASLVDAYLKRRVTVRRTDPATGRVTEGEGVIQSGPANGVVLTTAAGVEALGCSGLPEAIRYSGVPADLAAKPTLSVTTVSAVAQTVTVQLSYLAQGFDWQASYVAELAPDGATLDLFAWLTVRNAGSQGFADARTAAVAGAPNKERAARLPQGVVPDLSLQCWPMGTTSDMPQYVVDALPAMSMPAPPPAPAMEIVVTGARARKAEPVMMAEQEDLGDLKLYRVPEPVTVAALSTKQVAMLHRERVKVAHLYRGDFTPFANDMPRAAAIVLRAENKAAQGLGLPLPAGKVALFAPRGGQSLLLGESNLADRAIGEEVEFFPSTASDVHYTVTALPGSRRRTAFRIEVRNAHDRPVRFELPIRYRVAKASAKLPERKGLPTWTVTVPANGTATLDLTLSTDR